MKIALFALLLFQGDDVERQFARISPKDAHASFDAIARLVTLSEKARGRIEAQAAKLPEDCAFYRTVLLEELKAKDRLGTQYGKESRLSIAAAGRMPVDVLAELQEKSGLSIDPGWSLKQNPGQPIDLKLDDVTPLDALREICRLAKQVPHTQGDPSLIVLSQNAHDGDLGFAFRNFLIYLTNIARMKVIDFGAPSKQGLSMSAEILWDKGIEIAGVEQAAVVLEATDGTGQPLLPADRELSEALKEEEDDGRTYHSAGTGWAEIHLRKPPDGTEKIGRLRGYVTLLAPSQTTELAFAELAADVRREDDRFEATIRIDPRDSSGQNLMVRLRLKSGTVEDLRKVPIRVTIASKDGKAWPTWASGRAVGDREIEYRVTTLGKAEKPSGCTLRIYRVTTPRRLYFEMRDIPIK